MRAARVRAPGSSPSHLGPPTARIPGLVWARRAPLMLMMRAPAVRIMRSRPRAKAASSNLLALHRTDQKPAPTPHGMRARFRSHSPANFEFPRRAGDPARARITSISGTPATQRSRVGDNGVFFIKASPLRLRQARAAQKGPAALPDLMAAANCRRPQNRKEDGGIETRSVALHRKKLNP